jgi:NAD(P)-dependent dehydrogenase (short-subunit alcohol dehydrogenase family)
LKTIVITGSTRGIGYGLSHAFLARGCQVTISGRTHEAAAEAVRRLAAEFGSEPLFGYPCDVTVYEQVQALWDASREHWGQVDIWINNAGIAHAQTQLWDQSPEEMAAVVQTNVIGSMYGAQVALRGMLDQGWGSLYNLEGLGSDGRRVDGLTAYGTTKHALTYFTDALVEETKGAPIVVGALRPGMVVTDMLTQQYETRPEDWKRAKRVFNILADQVETVTPWLADQILANDRTGVRFKWLGGTKATLRFLLAPFRKRDLFENDRVRGP